MWVDYRGSLSTVYNDRGDLNTWSFLKAPICFMYIRSPYDLFPWHPAGGRFRIRRTCTPCGVPPRCSTPPGCS